MYETISRTAPLATVLLLVLTTIGAGCTESQNPTGQQTKALEFKTKTHRLHFRLPKAWQATQQGTAQIYAGPKNTSDYYTTLGFQPFASSDLSLRESLEAAYEKEKEFQAILWHQREKIEQNTLPALRYKVEFLFYEMSRVRTGILLDLGQQLLDISYTAPKDMFESNQNIFEQVLKELEVAKRDTDAKS